MLFAYVRVSTDQQTVENQRFEILKFVDKKKIHVGEWIEEAISGTKKYQDRKQGKLLQGLKKEDIFIVSELSRLGRNLMEVMSILHDCMEREIKVYAIKEGYELGKRKK